MSITDNSNQDIEPFLRFIFASAQACRDKTGDKRAISNAFALSRELLKPIHARSRQDALMSWRKYTPLSAKRPISAVIAEPNQQAIESSLPSTIVPIVFDVSPAKKIKEIPIVLKKEIPVTKKKLKKETPIVKKNLTKEPLEARKKLKTPVLKASVVQIPAVAIKKTDTASLPKKSNGKRTKINRTGGQQASSIKTIVNQDRTIQLFF